MNFKVLETTQKLRGRYYTEPDIAAFLTAWAMENRPQAVLEPSCGDGAFIEAVAGIEHASLTTFVACEIDPDEADRATAKASSLRKVKTSIFVGDFLEWSLAAIEKARNLTP